jgi:GT2 family glycosyltransferase/tetratricopeptide (TPR) repeat protein
MITKKNIETLRTELNEATDPNIKKALYSSLINHPEVVLEDYLKFAIFLRDIDVYQSLKILDEAQNKFGENPWIEDNLARASVVLQNFDDAVEHWEKALLILPEFAYGRDFFTKELISIRKIIAEKYQVKSGNLTNSIAPIKTNKISDDVFLLCDNQHSTLIVKKDYLKENKTLELHVEDEESISIDLSNNQHHPLLNINQIWDSAFDVDTSCWKSLEAKLSRDFSKDWKLKEGHTAHFHQGSKQINDSFVFVYKDPVIGEFLPVSQGEYYQIGGNFSCHRCDALLTIEFYNSKKEKTQNIEIEIPSDKFLGGKELKHYLHISKSIKIPEAVFFARISLIKLPTKPNTVQKDSFLFLTHLFFMLVPVANTVSDWSKNPFSFEEWQKLRNLNTDEIIGVQLSFPKSIFDNKKHVIEIQDSETKLVIASDSFYSQRSNYHWERLRANLDKACVNRDWKAGSELLFDWINKNPHDAHLVALSIVNHTEAENKIQGVFETATADVLHILRSLAEITPNEPCVWQWLVEVSYQLGRWQECVTAYHKFAELSDSDKLGDERLVTALITSLEKSYRYEEAFHALLHNWAANFENKRLKKAFDIIVFCNNLQLLPEEVLWLCRADIKNKQNSAYKLVLLIIPRLASSSLVELLGKLNDSYSWAVLALVSAFEQAEMTNTWSDVLNLLEILDTANMLEQLPDWLAVEVLWMVVQLERLVISSEKGQDAVYKQYLEQLKSFQFWKDVVVFDHHFPLLDQNYLRYGQTWKQPPKVAITSLREFLAIPESATVSPHILFNTDFYKNYKAHKAQEDKKDINRKARHLLVDFFRHSNSCAENLPKPNPYFDCNWYKLRYLAEDETQHPLLHYLTHFEKQGIHPNQYFNNDYVRETQGLLIEEEPVSFYLAQLKNGGIDFCVSGFSPSPFFDRNFYLQSNSDVAGIVKQTNLDPLMHFIEHGEKEGRQAYQWQHYNQFVRHQMLELEPNNQNSPVVIGHIVPHLKNEKAEKAYFAGQRILAKQLVKKPLISIVVPVYQVKPLFLQEMIESVLAQTYENWQLCMVDDASKRYSKEIKALFENYAQKDSRIVYSIHEKNGHICQTTNDCLTLATGEFVALLDHDDLLTQDALYEIALVLNNKPDTDILYSDEDKMTEWGVFKDPYYKPDWSPHTLWSRMYICHLSVYRKTLIEKVGGFRIGLEGSQDHDLMLRCSNLTSKIHHIPRVLYHWRIHAESTAGSENQKGYCADAGKRAVEDLLNSRGLEAEVKVVENMGSMMIAKLSVIGTPSVDIIIPSRDQAETLSTCLTSIFSKTTYPNIKVTVVDNNSSEPDFFTLMDYWKKEEPIRFQVIEDSRPFNYSAINNAAIEKTTGDFLILLNNDTEVISENWVEGMLGYAQLKEVGAVGVKLYYPDDTIQHVGVATGIGGVAVHLMKNQPKKAFGYWGNAIMVTNYSAVTAACLMISREKFNLVGGFEEFLQVAFNDVDFCLKVREQGLFNVYLPFVELYHYESKSRGHEDTPAKAERFACEIQFIRQRWGKSLDNDPFYSPWLTIENESMGYRFH